MKGTGFIGSLMTPTVSSSQSDRPASCFGVHPAASGSASEPVLVSVELSVAASGAASPESPPSTTGLVVPPSGPDASSSLLVHATAKTNTSTANRL